MKRLPDPAWIMLILAAVSGAAMGALIGTGGWRINVLMFAVAWFACLLHAEFTNRVKRSRR